MQYYAVSRSLLKYEEQEMHEWIPVPLISSSNNHDKVKKNLL
jgi:hypothetical protein